jgi:hypothetical protein
MHPDLPLDTESPFQFVFTKIKNKAAQDALVGLASSIETGCATDLALTTRLMYMAMHTDQWLKLLYGSPHACTANWNSQNIAHRHFGP